NARHPAEKVQRGSLAREQSSGWTRDFCDDRSILEKRSVLLLLSETDPGIEFAPHRFRDLQTGDHSILFGDDAAAQRRMGRDNTVGGYVAAADIFRERTADGFRDLRRKQSFVFEVFKQSSF